MKIYLNIEADSPAEFRTALAELMGSTSITPASAGASGAYETATAGMLAQNTEGTSTSDVSSLSASAADTTPQRERGKPGQGRARRTKEEIAEDEAADKADAAAAAAGAETGSEVADRQISTSPEDRKDAEQDAADEAAETAAASTGKLTHDDVRNALGAYVAKFGMDAAQADGPKMLADACGPETKKISDVPEAKLADVVALVSKASAADSRYGGLDL